MYHELYLLFVFPQATWIKESKEVQYMQVHILYSMFKFPFMSVVTDLNSMMGLFWFESVSIGTHLF
jgi:hypothetical protein